MAKQDMESKTKRRSSVSYMTKRSPLDAVIFVIITLGFIIMVYPFYNSFLISIVSKAQYLKTPFMLYPKDVTWQSYEILFRTPTLWDGYKVTLIVVFFGVLYNMFLTTTLAYGLSRKRFPGKGILMNLIIVTMYFGGGMIPSYLLIKKLGLMNRISALILPTGLNTFYMLIMRNYFQSLPASLEESAKIDGARDLTILFRIILPISAPVISTITLFYALDRWNDWFGAVLYIKDVKKYPLQLVLRNALSIVITPEMDHVLKNSIKNKSPMGLKMAALFLSMIPIMCVYPFVQKYFVNGIMVGAIKG
jgi:putative aldouronate transport system permease protein